MGNTHKPGFGNVPNRGTQQTITGTITKDDRDNSDITCAIPPAYVMHTAYRLKLIPMVVYPGVDCEHDNGE